MRKKRKKLRGTVEKIIKPSLPNQPEKAQITINEADDLYKEIRIENTLTNDEGKKERLESGEEVDLTLEVDNDSKDKKSN